MMDIHAQIGLIGIAWILIIILFQQYIATVRVPTIGAPLAFVLIITLNHLGALVHIDPNYNHRMQLYLNGLNYDTGTVLVGFWISLIGLVGFVIGVALIDLAMPKKAVISRGGLSVVLPRGRMIPVRENGKAIAPLGEAFLQHARYVAVIGLSGYILPNIVLQFPGSDALFGGLRLCFIAGVIGMFYWHVRIDQRRSALIVMIIGASTPVIVGLLSDGIFGDAIAEAFLLFAFYLCLARPRYRSVVKGTMLLTLVSFAVLYLSAAWMAARDDVRTAVWGQASLTERVETTVNSFVWELRNLKRIDMQFFFDQRLNQNVFIGLAEERIDAGLVAPAAGQTLVQASYAWIPRMVWPDKPTRGGSDFIDYYTGKQTFGSTSFGVGAIMEFFVNFGKLGVFVGMMFFAFLLRFLDWRAATHLRRGLLRTALKYIVLTVPFISALAVFFFLVNELAVALIIALLIRATAPSGARLLASLLPSRGSSRTRARSKALQIHR